jgi:hypothetical protein
MGSLSNTVSRCSSLVRSGGVIRQALGARHTVDDSPMLMRLARFGFF